MPDSVEPHASQRRIEVIAYSVDHFDRKLVASVAEASAMVAAARERGATARVWIDIEGVPLGEALVDLGALIPLHPMAAELLRNGAARALVEDFGGHLLATMVYMHHSHGAKAADGADGSSHVSEVIDFIFDDRVLVTIQERPGDCFDGVRERLALGSGQVRAPGAAFLFSLLGRAICDSYLPILEKTARRIDRIEDALAERPDRAILVRIHHLRTRLLELRRQLIPLQDSIAMLLLRRPPADPGSTAREVDISMRSLLDELAELRDALDFQRDEVQRLTDLYLNSVSNRLNDVMRILAIISTLFMPLSFLASLYGMNFDRERGRWNMPELGWEYGYLFVLGLMSVVAVGLTIFFWRKGWLAEPTRSRRRGVDGLTLDVVEFVGLTGPSGRGAGSRRRRAVAKGAVRARGASTP
ncbi:MAG: magnesium/cobalt transporter CorA [Phycisphaera sp.]|nr:magnesium/cobalt transporter CorA [Phycisphaera sp.]